MRRNTRSANGTRGEGAALSAARMHGTAPDGSVAVTGLLAVGLTGAVLAASAPVTTATALVAGAVGFLLPRAYDRLAGESESASNSEPTQVCVPGTDTCVDA